MNGKAAARGTDTPADSPAAADWTAQRERSNLLTLRLMAWIATTLGRRVARAVLHPITLYFLCFGGAATRHSAAYLERVLGRPPRWAERYRHIHHFAATVLDRVYLLQERFDNFQFEVRGAEHLDPVLAEGQGALLVGGHLGSFEALRALGQGRHGVRVAMLMYEDNARLINATLHAIAPKAELHTIALGRLDAMLTLQQWLDGGGVAGLLADRTLPAQGQRSGAQSLPFLGDPAAFSDGPFRLAALLRRPIVFMAGLYHGGNRYELRFLPVADFRDRPRGAALDAAVRDAMARYASILEGLCRESPYNWFNFFDFWAPPAAPAPTHAPTASPAPAEDGDHDAERLAA
ncbi:acyl-CoA synthetase [Caldimonas brevitalea]|uniref:Acyl-CoA synthetase n=1 Tax=Caldimonas brevitalea TaxID=413882 RepID=A0A0G3BM07_9BURK|nr:acyl-CoA synthetase [Caldimonas brevitalea]AKJ30469.1 acyl-CoA synthetase [Caldimonas brevitalea]